ncbi:MAG: polysaccharide deacetylase family protein [Endomicrobiales bacterium]|nr:polysaccharide deacetylase family protein [Endomicrobiales bacterium]
MFNIKFHLVIYRYEILVACIILLLTGSIVVSSRDKEQKFYPVERYPYKIALTFDDGPHPGHTEKLVTVLKDNDVRATFFVVGRQALLYPELIHQIALAGNEIESHTFSHKNLTKLPDEDVKRELVITRKLIKDLTGQKCDFFRPPGGRYDNRVIKIASEIGQEIALWTVLPKDHEKMSAQDIVKKVLEQSHDKGVVLLHSGMDATLEALPKIIQELKDRGYKLVTLEELRGEYPDGKFVWASENGEKGYY